MSARPWTDDEIGFLQDHEDWSAPRVAEALGRTASAVENARHSLKVGRLGGMERSPWTDEEDALLIDAPSWVTAKALAESLPGRTVHAINHRRKALGVRVLGERPHDIAGRPLVAKSCVACGLLLSGSWFLSHKRAGYIAWSPRCRACCSKAASDARSRRDPDRNWDRDREERLQRITAEGATRNGQPYTEADYQVLADFSLTDFQKAIQLKRTLRATGAARRGAGLKSKPDGLGDPERDVWVIDNPNLPMEASA